MKNLHKKISAVLLAGALLVGGSLSNGSMVHASSKNSVAFDAYMSEINKIQKIDYDLYDGYGKMGDRIKDAVKRLESRYKFKNFIYLAFPYDYMEMLCENVLKMEFNVKNSHIQDSYLIFDGPYELVDFMLGNNLYHNIPYLVRVRGDNGNYYKFVILVR